jgi:hypothetical protein
MTKIEMSSAIFVLLSSMQLMAKTTLITNVNGYTLSDKSLKKFSAISFTNDTINKVYSLGMVVKTPRNAVVKYPRISYRTIRY